ncbi:hypothetical protein BGX28_004418 [Mortierella sp. GBA30]|nr:hypothetical protein BGX28_004418 [Mortierella sp. GBA30]
MIDGLTPEELFESICFENDHEGTPGFFGPAEFAREQKKRKEDEEQLKSGAAVVSNNKSSPGVVVKISKAMVSTTAALFGY